MQKPLPALQRAHFRQQVLRARSAKNALPSDKNRPSANAHTFASKSRERSAKNRPSVKQTSPLHQRAHMRQQELRALRKNRPSAKQKSPIRQCAHMRQQVLRARKKTPVRQTKIAHPPTRTLSPARAASAQKNARPSNKNRPSTNAHTCASKCCERAKKTPVRQTKSAHPPTRTLAPASAACARSDNQR